jgi:hypothetical protein
MIQGGSTAACCGRSPARAGLLHACRVICCIPLSSLNLQLPSRQCENGLVADSNEVLYFTRTIRFVSTNSPALSSYR